VLVLLSRSSLTSQWQRHEIAMAVERAESGTRRRNVVPIFLNRPRDVFEVASQDVREKLGRIQGFDFSGGEFEGNMSSLKRWLRSYEWRA
jgi:hypothetical protein